MGWVQSWYATMRALLWQKHDALAHVRITSLIASFLAFRSEVVGRSQSRTGVLLVDRTLLAGRSDENALAYGLIRCSASEQCHA